MFACGMSLQRAAGVGRTTEVGVIFIFWKSARIDLSNCTIGSEAAVSTMAG